MGESDKHAMVCFFFCLKCRVDGIADLGLRVEQPVGTGFSIGEVTAKTEEEIAQDFIKFFKNWETTFGIKDYKIYVTGESYAGRYVPYISAAMLDEKDKEYYDLSGKSSSVSHDIQPLPTYMYLQELWSTTP